MVSNRAYKRCDVKKVDVEVLRDRACDRGGAATAVGLDVAKQEIVACVRWADGSFERPWRVKNPAEIPELVKLLQVLRQVCDGLRVGLESTGTYSEGVRRALTLAGLEVHRVSGKAASDYQEVFDGVPSQHDGKDAALLAELTAFGKGTPWPFAEASPTVQQIEHQVLRIDAFAKQKTQWLGRLEGLLAAHWPELTSHLSLCRVSLLRMLAHYGSPAEVAADAQAAARLSRWGGPKLTPLKIEQVLESARLTGGTPMSVSQRQWMQEVAEQALSMAQEVRKCERRLEALAKEEPSMRAYVDSVGAVTLGVIFATVGDPRHYDSSGAFLKALGLNLKERSSGRRQGQLAISKRGPSRARRWLYYWALRAVQREEVRPWHWSYCQTGQRPAVPDRRTDGRKMKGVVAVMRKLCRGLWRACRREAPFDYAQVLKQRGSAGSARRRRRRRRSPSARAAR